jgi:RNA polymerase sigma factor (sigma-70 family)
VGRGTSGALAAPGYDGAGSPADNSDQQLVARVRQGDDRAFEVLYQRYHRRIHAYVLGMVKDHGRAEDVTQEVFVSALRRMRETEQPLAFKPWIYQIAKNSCIDAFRRSKRAEEVSYDADDALAPSDHSRLVGSGPTPDAAVAAKQDLDNLCGAFGGLSETHHEILVLRELEGLSYQEIGRRMGMSRPAVESTLFRARRRLTEEYDDIVSGARCLRIQGIILAAAQSRLGARDTRRLARHLSHCQPCRREALAAGLDRGLLARPSVRERVAGKVAGVLPLPIFTRFRRGAEDASAAAPPSGRGAAFMSHLPLFAEQGWGKAFAGAAVLVAGVGAGLGVHQHQPRSSSPEPVSVQQAAPVAAKSVATAAPVATTEARDAAAKRSPQTKSSSRRAAAERKSPASAADQATRVGGGPAGAVPTPEAKRDTTAANSGPAKAQTESAGSEKGSKPPALGGAVPPVSATEPVEETVKQTTDAVTETTKKTTEAIDEATQGVTQGIDDTVRQTTGDGPVTEGVDKITDDVDTTVDQVTDGLDRTVEQTNGTINGIVGAGG